MRLRGRLVEDSKIELRGSTESQPLVHVAHSSCLATVTEVLLKPTLHRSDHIVDVSFEGQKMRYGVIFGNRAPHPSMVLFVTGAE